MPYCSRIFLFCWIWLKAAQPWPILYLMRTFMETIGQKRSTTTVPFGMRLAHQDKEPSHFLNLPPEIRLEIYSYLLPNVHSYTSGISDPIAVSQPSLRSDSEPSYPAILFTCRKIYHEAVLLLYHNRCFNVDIAGHLLRSVANRRNRISALNIATWLGLSSYFKEHWPTYDIDNLDFTRMEEICVTFWPVHGDPTKLEDARLVATGLCRRLRKASRLRKISIKFRDVWLAPQADATMMNSRYVDVVEYLLQPFKILRGIEQVKFEVLASHITGEESERAVTIQANEGRKGSNDARANGMYGNGTILR